MLADPSQQMREITDRYLPNVYLVGCGKAENADKERTSGLTAGGSFFIGLVPRPYNVR
jgi:hypothetical protein